MIPFFLDGSAGRLFAIYHPPAEGVAVRGDAVFVPPFGEEMNRSRRMATVLARRLAPLGIGVLVFDFFGTGDSEGEFAAARLDIWRDDLGRALRWLDGRGARRVDLVGLRFGAHLALEAGAGRDAGATRIVLWQPIASGELMMTQLLRIRVSAGLTGAGGVETMASLRARFARGESIDIAGYEISSRLAADLDVLDLDKTALLCRAPIHWLELVAGENRPIPPGSARRIETWRKRGTRVEARAVVGEPFWTLLETTIVPRLAEVTAGILAEERVLS